MAWHSMALHGVARRGIAWQGSVWHGMEWRGDALHGMAFAWAGVRSGIRFFTKQYARYFKNLRFVIVDDVCE